MADDIVEWLRKEAKYLEGIDSAYSSYVVRYCEAADRIERLQSLLDGRDEFIVRKGLWHDFVSTLPLKTEPIMRDGRIVGYVADFKDLKRQT